MSALIETAIELETLAKQLRREAATPPKIGTDRTVANIAAEVKERFGTCHISLSVYSYTTGGWNVNWTVWANDKAFSGATPEEAIAAAVRYQDEKEPKPTLDFVPALQEAFV
jgi:hypothetical protein